MDFPWTPMFRTAARLDQSGGRPPWQLLLYNPDSQGWEPIGSPGPAGPTYAPLMTGDAAPTMIGTGDGQPVLVPIS